METFGVRELESLLSPTRHGVPCSHAGGHHELCCWEWPAQVRDDDATPTDRQTVFCVHGLTRTGRDFDVIASRLARQGHRVIAPDMAGRGGSDWLDDSALYAVPQYLSDALSVITHFEVHDLAWVGTSMGGLIGMGIASMPEHPIERLLLNDIGAEVPAEGLQRIAESLKGQKRFSSFAEGERVLREAMMNFGPHSDAAFRVLSRHYIVQRDDHWVYHYDPRIAEPFEAALTGEALSIWPVFEAVSVPVTILRGERSDVLSESTARAMADASSGVTLITIEGVGHAPTLIDEGQCRLVEDFLNG